MDAAEIKVGLQLAQFIDDLVAANGGVLNVGSRLTLELQSFFEVECDYYRSCKLQQKISQRPHRNLVRNFLGFGGREAGIAFSDFLLSFRFQGIQQIIGFDALSFASRYLQMRSLAIFRGYLNSKLFGTSGAERHNLIRQMNGAP